MTKRRCSNPEAPLIERAFDRKREELGVRCGFPPEVEAAARDAAGRAAAAAAGHADRTGVPFVTIDPPGSRDLDQALHIERSDSGLRVWYAIADVGCFVERGGAVEREAWLRGVTFYAPDRRETLYPPALSEGAASLLPDDARPAVVFRLDLDARAELVGSTVERAVVHSRAQLTYAQALEHVEGGGAKFTGEEWADSLVLLKEFGELRRAREVERGGVSLPIPSQHVERSAATRLGYELEYEEPNAAEEWNAQVSLLTGHVAALRMLAARVGILRLLPPVEKERVHKFRHVARALGFRWPQETGYAEFIRSLDPAHPNATALVWQAKRVMQGADYAAFDGEPPADPLHHALAMPYAHVTAPLRRLADRYVLDLLVRLEGGGQPDRPERETLGAVAEVMNAAETRSARLERAVVDVAEAFLLRERIGERFPATVLGIRGGRAEVQIERPPVRVEAARPEGARFLNLGERVEVRLAGVSVEEGKLEFVVEE